MISSSELIRYQRQLIIKDWDDKTQERLKESTVFVAGTGGLGSPLLYYLAVAGVGILKICDFDIVSLSNLNRQILHSNKDLGQYKVDSAYETLTNANPEINVIKVQEKLTYENASKIIGDVTIIIDCLDNFETRYILNKFSVQNEIAMIHAGVSEFMGQITVLNPPDTPCLACIFPPEIKKERIPIVGATAGVIGSLQAVEAIKFLTGIGSTLENKLLFWDGIDMSFRIVKLNRNQECAICKTK